MSEMFDEPTFDRAQALLLVDGHLNLLIELAETFLREHAKLVQEVEQAVAQKDAASLQRAAHGLRGALAYFGPTRSLRTAARLEQMAIGGNLEGLEPLHRTLRSCLCQLIEVLTQLVGQKQS